MIAPLADVKLDCVKLRGEVVRHVMRGLRAVVIAALVAAPWTSSTVLAQDPTSGPAIDPQAEREALRLVDVWLDSQQAYQRIPALSGTIVQGDKIIWSAGYGTLDAAHKIPATAETLYSICSISKLFTVVALMQLWESGRVRLDDPVTTYLPWARLKPLDQDGLPITLRAILSHSAGLPREADFPYWTGPDFTFPTEEQLQSRLAEQTPLWPASLRFQYSNLGLTLIGDTVSAVSGEPYAEYVRANILEPLGLKDTHPFMPMSLYGKRLAVGWGSITRDGSRELLRPFDTRALTPAAGYTSTAEDLGRFAAWQFRLLRTGRREVLNASSLREMQRVQFVDPGWKNMRGLGFEVVRKGDQTFVGHIGDCPGYHSIIWLRAATETAVALMMTGERPRDDAIAVFDILDKRLGWQFKPPSPAADVDLESYAGRYSAQPWHSELMIVPWAKGLALLWLPSADPAEDIEMLKAKGGDRFRRIRADGSEADEVHFERDRSGRVSRFIEFSNPHERIGELPSGRSKDP
jgi:CubicO group peptidase (beta-lactamase class C family)